MAAAGMGAAGLAVATACGGGDGDGEEAPIARETPTAGATAEVSLTNRSENEARASWECSFLAGQIGAESPVAGGTEIVHIEAHQGKLFAGNGYWMDSAEKETIPGAQILALDSLDSKWSIDLALGASQLRVTALKSVTFRTDDKGNPLPEEVNLLLTGSDQYGMDGDPYLGESNVWTRDDATGSWERTILHSGHGGIRMVRAFFVHRDLESGVERIFVSVGQPGIFSGLYDPAEPGKIRWDKTPEFGPLETRPMSFAEANGQLFMSSGTSIYRRKDGRTPEWEEVYTDDTDYHWAQGGVRGLTAIPSPVGEGESLLFNHTNRLIRLNPNEGYAASVELNIDELLQKEWDRSVQGESIIAAYSDMVPITDPSTGQTVHLTGVEARVSGPHTFGPPKLGGWYPGAAYLIRNPDLTYRLREVNGRWEPGDPLLVGIRTIKVSPFPEDGGEWIYVGGFDANFIEVHDTAWIYRAPVETVLAARSSIDSA